MPLKPLKDNSQCARLLAHFKAGGSVTSFEAYDLFKITQLSARIMELEARGIAIARVCEENDGARYVRYSMGGAA
ncbi:helix-turn-helix domain-containing protein [Neisseria bacilliformis]|nr:helix-turn-helix domain-containing protein [Neisseria bacilliformis]QMT48197.1 helix-turn-helix domain-containing protein [Neisseria bacilliformis]